VKPHPDGEPDTFLRLEANSQLPHGFHHPEPGPHRPRRIIFVRLGVSKVHQQTIAQILGNMPLIAGDHFGAGLLVSSHHLTQTFGVELTGERGRVHQVAEQHRELAALGLHDHLSNPIQVHARRLVSFLGSWLLSSRPSGDTRLLLAWRLTPLSSPSPDQHLAPFINGQPLGLDDLGLELLEIILVEVESSLERPIGCPPLPLEYIEHLRQDLVKCHPRSSVTGRVSKRRCHPA
jgi:hypothetical protein